MTEFDKIKALADTANNRVSLDTEAIAMAMMRAMQEEIECQAGDKVGIAVSSRAVMHQLVADVVFKLSAGVLAAAYEANTYKNPYYAMGRDAADLAAACQFACIGALNQIIQKKGGQ